MLFIPASFAPLLASVTRKQQVKAAAANKAAASGGSLVQMVGASRSLVDAAQCVRCSGAADGETMTKFLRFESKFRSLND